MGGLGLGLDILLELDAGLRIGLIVSIQPGLGGDGEPGILQALLHIDKVAGIHLAGAGAALDGFADTAAVCRDFTGSG